MRRDILLQNDTRTFSVVSGCAIDEIVEARGADDAQFVRRRHALLMELAGADSGIVRLVVDEPLTEAEEREWLARARWHLDVADGRVLVTGALDAAVLDGWQSGDQAASDDGRVAMVTVDIGLWDVDVYTYAGSVNGNATLRGGTPMGQRFRRHHPGVPVPLWLARLLDAEGSHDPDHEVDWFDAQGSVAAGRLTIATDTHGFVGMLVHVHQRATGDDDSPAGHMFGHADGARTTEQFPLGIAAHIADPQLVAFAGSLSAG